MAITYTDVRNRKAQADALSAVNNYLVQRQDARKPVIEEEDEKSVTTIEDIKSFYSQYNIENLEDKAGFDATLENLGKLDPNSFAFKETSKDFVSDVKRYAPKPEKDKKVIYQYTQDDLETGRKMFDEGSNDLFKYNKLFDSAMAYGLDTEMGQKRAKKALDLSPSAPKTPKTEKPFIPDYREEEKIIASQLVAEGRKVNAPVAAVKDAEGNVIKKGKPGWGKYSDESYIISPSMKKLHRRMREAQLANDLAKEDRRYTGQVVHKPEDIRVFTDANSGVIGIEDTPWYEKNVKPQVIEFMKQNPGLSDEELTSVIQNIAFNLVKERQDAFGALRNPEQYYTLYIDRVPDRFEFDKIKNLYEGFGMPLKNNERPR
tara:strand:- start:6099 stop:7220 length:1122 start_codon:yes stop_codon:yes gene_type:complete